MREAALRRATLSSIARGKLLQVATEMAEHSPFPNRPDPAIWVNISTSEHQSKLFPLSNLIFGFVKFRHFFWIVLRDFFSHMVGNEEAVFLIFAEKNPDDQLLRS